MQYPERIYFVGYMGSGKTTTGRKLAAKLNYKFIDLDKLIERTYKTSIPLLFKKYDEQAFRLLEQKMLRGTQSFKQTVISTGGGAPCFFDNMEKINQYGISIYLKLTPEQLMERLKKAQKKRPLIENLDDEQLFEYIKKNLQQREPFYNQAHIITDGTGIITESVLMALKQYI